MSDDNNDNDDIKFRDECAIHIMTMFLNSEQKHCKQTLDLLMQYHGSVAEGPMLDNKAANNKEYSLKRIEKYAQLSYKVADIMRKARLASFK